jgi:hypothetical protein
MIKKSDYIKLSEYLKTNQLQIGDTVANSIGMAINSYDRTSIEYLQIVKPKPIFI